MSQKPARQQNKGRETQQSHKELWTRWMDERMEEEVNLLFYVDEQSLLL